MTLHCEPVDSFDPAQLVAVGFEGGRPPNYLYDLIRRGLAGVVLFARNAGRPHEVTAMLGDLQECAARAGWPPLLVTIDHEGGRVQRLQQGFTPLPPAMAIGAAGDQQLAYDLAKAAAAELRAAGINVNLAPCADVNSNRKNPVIGTRSFGGNPEAVGRMVSATVRGYQDGGVLAVAKHFPGHGDTHQDSHLTLPVIEHSPAVLESVDLLPFRQAIEAGVAGIMSAHIVIPWLTGGLPATLSRAALDGLLRGRLGFRGVVVTDCLEMQAIAAHFSPSEASVRAVAAGADLLMWSHTPDWQLGAVRALEQALSDGTLDAAQVASAIARVHRARRLVAATTTAAPQGACGPGGALGACPAQTLAERVWREAITLVRDDGLVLPLSPGTRVLVAGGDAAPASGARDPAANTPVDVLCLELRRLGRDAAALRANDIGHPDGDTASGPGGAAGGVLVCLTHSACLRPDEAGWARELLRQWAPRPAVLVATGLPYDAVDDTPAGAALAVYGQAGGAMRALAEVLVGMRQPRGKLPTELPSITLD